MVKKEKMKKKKEKLFFREGNKKERPYINDGNRL